MSKRDKGDVYTCPKCDKHGFAWDGRAKVWMCHYVSCSYTEKATDSADQLQTMFEALRYLVYNTLPLHPDVGLIAQSRLVDELDEIVKLGE